MHMHMHMHMHVGNEMHKAEYLQLLLNFLRASQLCPADTWLNYQHSGQTRDSCSDVTTKQQTCEFG